MADNTAFFIVGCARSGTTLLRSILSSHPRIVIPGETSFFMEHAWNIIQNKKQITQSKDNSGNSGINIHIVKDLRI